MPSVDRRPAAQRPVQVSRPVSKTLNVSPPKVYLKPVRVPEDRIVRKVYVPGETAPRLYQQKEDAWVQLGAMKSVDRLQAEQETS